jgi:hypothetical protein
MGDIEVLREIVGGVTVYEGFCFDWREGFGGRSVDVESAGCYSEVGRTIEVNERVEKESGSWRGVIDCNVLEGDVARKG